MVVVRVRVRIRVRAVLTLGLSICHSNIAHNGPNLIMAIGNLDWRHCLFHCIVKIVVCVFGPPSVDGVLLAGVQGSGGRGVRNRSGSDRVCH